MGNFLLLFFCLILGGLLKKFKVFPKESALYFNRFVIYVSLPALTLRELHKIDFKMLEFWIPLMPWILFGLAWLFFRGISSFWKIPKLTMGALLLTAGLGNTSFVGFPILEWLLGPKAIATGILVDQGGSFLAAATLGVLAAQYYSGRRLTLAKAFLKIFAFPPFLAVLFSFALRDFSFGASLEFLIDRLANTLIPLALFSVGLQWELNAKVLREEKVNLFLGLGFKLFLAPIFFLITYGILLQFPRENLEVVLLESAMAPMITAGVIAVQYGLSSQTANTMIGLGIPLSLITVPIWKMIFDLVLF